MQTQPMYFSDDFLNNILNCCFLQQFHGPPTFDSKLLTITVLSFYQPQSGMVMQRCRSKVLLMGFLAVLASLFGDL